MSDFNEGFNKINIPGYKGGKSMNGSQKPPFGGGQNQGRPQQYTGGYGQRQQERLPEGYLEGGYFEEIPGEQGRKKLKKDLILSTAKELAFSISNSRPEIGTSQMRKYYDYAKNIGEKLRQLGGEYQEVEADIAKLVPFVTDAKNKKKIPDIFFEFIKANVSAIHNADDFTKGFIEHFQAVIAYYPKRG